jgi:hypothetical protein
MIQVCRDDFASALGRRRPSSPVSWGLVGQVATPESGGFAMWRNTNDLVRGANKMNKTRQSLVFKRLHVLHTLLLPPGSSYASSPLV